MYWILFIGIALASWLVQANLKNKFEKYSKIPIDGGLTGRDIAVKMLHDNGIYDVEVVSTSGSLTDHYNPANKTVNLSEDVYDTCSVAAAAVAAHECGHVIQHARGYVPITIRTALVPIVNFASRLSMPLILIGLILGYVGLAKIGVVLFCGVLIFQLVTLPVEFDASARAMRVLDSLGILYGEEIKGARKVLTAAALTYVAAVVSTALQVFRLVLLINNRRD